MCMFNSSFFTVKIKRADGVIIKKSFLCKTKTEAQEKGMEHMRDYNNSTPVTSPKRYMRIVGIS